jgi:hypothetical protein
MTTLERYLQTSLIFSKQVGMFVLMRSAMLLQQMALPAIILTRNCRFGKKSFKLD